MVLSPVLWPKPKTSLLSIHGSRVSRYRPYLSRVTLPMGDSYIRCERSSVTWPALLSIVHYASGCSSPQDVPKKEISKNTVSFWLRRAISLAYQLSGKALPAPLSLGSGNPWYCPVSNFQEELRCQPGSEGGYLVSSHHLHAPLPQRLVSHVYGHLPPGVPWWAAQAML